MKRDEEIAMFAKGNEQGNQIRGAGRSDKLYSVTGKCSVYPDEPEYTGDVIHDEEYGTSLKYNKPVPIEPNVKIRQVKSTKTKIPPDIRLRSPEDAAIIFKGMNRLDREEFRVIYLSSKNTVLGVERVSRGSLNANIVHPREAFKGAMLHNAAAIIAAHNHPSGDTAPSKEDLAITERLRETGKIVGIEFYDHLIIGSNHFISMKEVGGW